MTEGAVVIQYVVTASLTLVVFIAVVGFARRAVRAKVKLDERERMLVSFLSDPEEHRDELLADPELVLARRGMGVTSPDEGWYLMKQMRAQARSCQIRIISAVELMPQLGLFGTVLGLILGLWLPSGSGSMSGLALALLTTLVGLFASIICKAIIEVPAQEQVHKILELLENERIVSAILAGAAESADSG